MLQRFGKPIAAVVGAALIAARAALFGDQHIDPNEGVQIAIAVTIAVSVWLVPLVPHYRWAKTAVAIVLSVLQAATTLIIGGLDNGDWIALALAALTVIGVGVAPAVSDNGISSKSPKAA